MSEILEDNVNELSGLEEKYAEVKQLVGLGKEKGFLLYDEIYEILPEELTSVPEELDEIYIRLADLGIEVVDDAERPIPVAKDETEEKEPAEAREEAQPEVVTPAASVIDKTNDPVRHLEV